MEKKTRQMVDPKGFAVTAEQMDKVIQRISLQNPSEELTQSPLTNKGWRVAIAPHDDYTYVGDLYSRVLKDVTAQTIIIFGVAHTSNAKKLNLANQLIFDSYPKWQAPYGDISVSCLREDIINELPEAAYQVNDEMQGLEHSVEATIPFIQHFNRNIEIVSILFPFMSYEKMEELTQPLAEAISKAVRKRNWRWGKDYAFVISTDAVHYGDEGWGGSNFALYGVDQEGYRLAVEYESKIINECLKGNIEPEKIKAFTQHILQENDYREYKWTWCGRYSVPCGLLTAFYLQKCLETKLLCGEVLGYGTSIDGRKHIEVEDLGMGTTAPANSRHWVGYVAIGYE